MRNSLRWRLQLCYTGLLLAVVSVFSAIAYYQSRAAAWQFAGLGMLVLLAALVVNHWLASQIVQPIARMTQAASAISAADLSMRIDASNVDVELAELAQVLNAMLERLEAAFGRQRQFTADASHELRTPLAIVRANAELALSQSRSPEEYRQTLETCLRAANRMNSLIQSLLSLARAEAGDPVMRFQSVDLAQLVTDCLTSFQSLAKTKEITLTADISPVVVHGDSETLIQLANNLLSNAIRYNRAGGIIHVRLTATADEALLTVADTGPGIADEDRQRIFERFFRVDKSRARASGGIGLGLSICKAIVAAHGGMLDFESKPGEGTTFRVRLPLR